MVKHLHYFKTTCLGQWKLTNTDKSIRPIGEGSTKLPFQVIQLFQQTAF